MIPRAQGNSMQSDYIADEFCKMNSIFREENRKILICFSERISRNGIHNLVEQGHEHLKSVDGYSTDFPKILLNLTLTIA